MDGILLFRAFLARNKKDTVKAGPIELKAELSASKITEML
jgi:hypothetical protein